MQGQRARHNLPAQLTRFVGRERYLEAVRALLRSGRLVTLTGAGGVGKTRLALETAARVATDYPDGAWLVELATTADPDLVPWVITATIEVPEEVGRDCAEMLAGFLASRSLLLLLDNCELLVEAYFAARPRRLTSAACSASASATATGVTSSSSTPALWIS